MVYYASLAPARWLVREAGKTYPYASAEARPDAPVPSPFDDADALEDLGDEIATLAAHIHAATQRLLVLIAEFDERRGWEIGGHRSCAHWLSFRTGINLGAAREKVRAARALRELPETRASMARGELSFSKVRALTRVATPENEGELLDYARGSTTAQLERFVRGFRLADAKTEAELSRIRHASRKLSVFPGDDGMCVVTGRLDPEVGALLMRAIEAASDALFRRERREAGEEAATAPLEASSPPSADGTTPAQRRADALGLLAERAFAAGFEGDGPVSGTRAERYQVVLHVEAATLERHDGPGLSELEDGTRVSAETSRRLACDASVVEMTHAPDGSILDVGRRRRTIPPAIRRALDTRDRGCRWPGCGSRFTAAHHARHWADGGSTKLDNLILTCAHHHRLLHEGGYRVEPNPWPGGRPVFYDPRGVPVPETPPPMRVGGPRRVEWSSGPGLIAENRSRGVDPDGRTAGAGWKCERDIPEEVWAAASEAAG